MKKSVISISFIFLVAFCIAQSDGNTNPALFKTKNAAIGDYKLPGLLKKYTGIRFIDARNLKGFIGFFRFPDKSNFYKIATKEPLETELNNAVNTKKSFTNNKDSLIIVLKHLWVYPSPEIRKQIDCHIKAFLFERKADTIFFIGKVEDTFRRKGFMHAAYEQIIQLNMQDFFSSLSFDKGKNEKYYSENDFTKLVYQKKKKPLLNLSDSGIFVTFNDFLKGNLIKENFSLLPHFEQFVISFDNVKSNERFGKSIWGLFHAGSLYIREDDKLFSKAFSVEETFATIGNFNVRNADSGDFTMPDGYINSHNATEVGTAAGTTILLNALSSKKGKITYTPFVLNMDTGELE